MKGAFDMKANSDTVQLSEPTVKRSSSFLVRVLAVTLSAVILMSVFAAAIILATRHHSPGHTDPQEKEYHATFHIKNEVMKEDVYMTKREGVYYLPEATVVLDFETALTMYRFYDSSLNLPDCYVTSFNTSFMMSPTTFMANHSSSEVDVQVTSSLDQSFQVTDIRVDNAILGPKASDICRGRHVYFLREMNDDEIRQKRALLATASLSYCCACCRCGCQIHPRESPVLLA